MQPPWPSKMRSSSEKDDMDSGSKKTCLPFGNHGREESLGRHSARKATGELKTGAVASTRTPAGMNYCPNTVLQNSIPPPLSCHHRDDEKREEGAAGDPLDQGRLRPSIWSSPQLHQHSHRPPWPNQRTLEAREGADQIYLEKKKRAG